MPEELSMLGKGGIERFVRENNLNFEEVQSHIQKVEESIKNLQSSQVFSNNIEDYDDYCKKCFKQSVESYIDYFNNNAVCEKQAFVVLGNASSGKSFRAKSYEKATKSIIIDSDRFKMGESTKNGNFEGFSKLYKKPSDRDFMQKVSSIAGKKTLEYISQTGMNIVLPKAASSLAKLEIQLQVLQSAGYDIHLILVEAPLETCADRNYYRYLVKQFANVYGLDSKGTLAQSGRFISVDTIRFLHDGSYATFFDAYQKKRYKSYKAIYNDKNTPKGVDIEIDPNTMQPLF